MSERAKKSRRPLRCTKRDLVRSIESAKVAGLQISSVRIEPDGTIHVITGASQEAPAADNPWDSSAL